MTHWSHQIARPAIANFAAYSSRGEATSAVHLDANESPWSPPPATPDVSAYSRYPAQQPPQLRQRLASLYGIKPEQLMIGRGADEAIDILMRTFCEPGQDSILICSPTFGYFSTAAMVQGAKIIDVPLDDSFAWKTEQIEATIQAQKPKIVFLCSPNNPTGRSADTEMVQSLCANHPTTLIVVDEAYAEFSDQGNLVPLLDAFDNLILLKTLSKAYALAGVRVGSCLACPEIINLMLKVLPPYPIPRPVESVTLRALTPAAISVHKQRLRIIKAERERVLTGLVKSDLIETAYASDANFILCKATNEDKLLSAIAPYNIRIRDFRRKIAGHFRISIGTPEENDWLLEALGAYTAPPKTQRTAEVFRKTNETDIAVRVNLDQTHPVTIETGLGFFDHMLDQIAKHSGISLTLRCDGDLEIDSHHTVEDVALAFGDALSKALGNKAGIGRYGFVMPMDETQANIAIDLSGRPAFVFNGQFPSENVGDFASEMCPHFFQSLSQSLGAAIHIDVKGENTHHMIEACFKGTGRALKAAFTRQGQEIPSTKGVL